MLDSSSSLRDSKENISVESPGKHEVSVEELDLMTSHVCFQIYHLPTMTFNRFLELAVPYVAPLIDALEAGLSTNHQIIFTRRLFAIIAARFGPPLIEEGLIDYFLERDHTSVPVMVTLGMKPHLTRYAIKAVATMARQMCRESDSLDAIMSAFRTPRVTLFVSSHSSIVFKEFLMHFLKNDFIIPPIVLEQLVENEIPVQECWSVLEKTLEIRLLNDTRTTNSILNSIKQLVECYSQLDPSCFLLEHCILKIKSYLLSERKNLDLCVFEYLVDNPPSQEIEFDDPSKDFDPFSNPSNGLWTPDPDYCTEPIRQSTKSLNTLNIIANVYASSDAFVKASQYTLLHHYILKGRQIPDAFGRSLVYIPESHCLSVMLKDFAASSGDNRIILSHEYWPKLSKQGHSEYSKSNNVIALEHLFDIHTYKFSYLQHDELQVSCKTSQAVLIDSLLKDTSINISQVNQEDAIFWLEQGIIQLNENTLTLSETLNPRPEARLLFSQLPLSNSSPNNMDAAFDFEPMKPFIKAMLTNLGPMSASKIHSTLAMFSSDYTNLDLNALITFLESQVSAGFLSFDSSLAAFK